jgi:nicotinamidase-related amidase
MDLHPPTTALVLVEFQNQWTAPGLYNSLVKGQLGSRGVVENARGLARAARGAGGLVVHAPLILDPENKRGWLARATGARVFTKGTPKAEITPGLYAEGDPVVGGRHGFDPFVGSDLEEILRGSGIRTALFAGFATDQCPAKGLRTALGRGFEGYLVSDCTATFTGFQQRRAERAFGRRTVSSGDVLAALGSRPAAA